MSMANSEAEVVNSREFNVSRELVFRAWTTPDLLAQWWGPHGFTNTFHECDIRPGGTWKFTMHGPNGVDHPNHSVFVEIVPLERILLDHLSRPEFRITATFEDLGGHTKVTFRQHFNSKEMFEQVMGYCAQGNEQNLDRLGKVLEEMAN